jgi:uncharacterized protein
MAGWSERWPRGSTLKVVSIMLAPNKIERKGVKAMPVTPNYPGVYIQEVSSNVRTIAPVPTATTAFIGRAKRGPVNDPVLCNGFADFEQFFGGLWLDSTLGFAVRDFFLNGGSQAVIVRIYHPAAPKEAGRATLAVGNLTLKARSPGAWGNELAARITLLDAKIAKQLADRYEVDQSALFNLTIRDLATGATEFLPNLTVSSGARQVDKIISHESRLVEYDGALPKTPPPASKDPAKGSPWDDETCYTKAAQDSTLDGGALEANDFLGDEAAKTGIYALEHADIFNLLCIPPYKDANDSDVDIDVLQAAADYCEKRRAMLICGSAAVMEQQASRY